LLQHRIAPGQVTLGVNKIRARIVVAAQGSSHFSDSLGKE
jgi:hypothetical protein